MFLDDKKNKLKNWLNEIVEKHFSYGKDATEEDKQRTKKNAMLAMAVAVLVAICVTFAVLSMDYRISTIDEVQGNDKVVVRITPGMASGEIGDLLAAKGVIDSTWKFKLAVKLNGAGDKFQAGTFSLQKNMTVGDALGVLINGRATSQWVTIPEGYDVRQIAKLLAKHGLVEEKEFLAAAKDFAPYDYIVKSPEADYAIEGFLFPDTYEFATDASCQDIMSRMAEEFDHKLTPELRQQASQRNLSVYELVTLASLVEKEARFPEDRPIIAQVFFKRLDINMPLQTDTTIQYLLDGPKENLSISDTKIDSPYNTYQHYGLPPGPIASPGMASIEAVLNPANTAYLYFVADTQGHNHYGYTYDEHLDLVDQVR